MSESHNLASYNHTTLSSEVGSHSLHLFMTQWDNEDNDDGVLHTKATISMHLSFEEVEDLIKELKLKLIQCHKAHVERI